MSVEKILSNRLFNIYNSKSDCEFKSSVFHFYQALFYAHDYLNRNNVAFYNLILRDFNFLLRKAGKNTLLFLIRSFFSTNFVSSFSVRSTYNALIDCLDPLACMYLAKIPDNPCIIF